MMDTCRRKANVSAASTMMMPAVVATESAAHKNNARSTLFI